MISYKSSSKDQPMFIAYLACIGFFWFNFLYQLNGRVDRVNYELKEVEPEISEVSICLDILQYNCSISSSDKNHEKCLELNSLTNYIMDEGIKKTPKKIITKAMEMNISKYFSTEPEYDYSILYLDARFLCIKYFLSENNFVLFNIQNLYSISSFIFLEEMDQSIDSHLFRYECSNFENCPGYILNRYQILVTYLESPYETNCEFYNEKKYKFEKHEPINSRGDCFNECLKYKYRMPSLRYSKFDDDEYLWDANNTIRTSIMQDMDYINNCSSTCKKLNCIYLKYIDLGFALDFVQNRLLIDLEEYKIIVNGKPALNIFQYYLQTFGLIACLFGYSILLSSENLIFYIYVKTSMNQSYQNVFKLIIKLKNIFIVLLIFFAIFNFSYLFKRYYDNIVDREKYYIHTYDKNYKIYFCFFMSRMIRNSPFKNKTDYEWKEKKFAKQLFYDNTINYLLANSLKLEDVLVSVKSNLRGESVKFEKGQRVFEKESLCFELFLEIKEKETIVFDFNVMSSKVYLMKKDMDLTIRSRRFFADQKSELETKYREGSLANCKDYAKETKNFCMSKQSCIDKCVLENYSKKKSKKYPLLVIFENDVRNNPERLEYSFSPVREKSVTVECRKKYSLPNCRHPVHNRDTKRISLEPPNQKQWNISLYENEANYIQSTNHALDKLLLDFITIYSILLGVNVPRLVLAFGKIFNFNFDQHLYVKYLCIISILILSSWHLFSIWKDAFARIEFLYFYNFFFETDVTQLFVCSEHNVDLNRLARPITGNDLFKLTKDVKIDLSFIEKIRYMDAEDYVRKEFIPTKELETKFNEDKNMNVSKNFRIETAFYLNYKCLKLSYSIDTSNPILNFYVYIFNVFLKKERSSFIFFLSSDFSIPPDNITFEVLSPEKSYQVNFDKYTNLLFDYFTDIVYKPSSYILDRFKSDHSSATTIFPLTSDYFRLKINNTSFEKYLNKQKFVENYQVTIRYEPKVNVVQEPCTICVTKNTYRRIRVVINKKSLASLLIDIFNWINLWFTFSFCDLVYIALNFIRHQFINLKNKIKIMITNMNEKKRKVAALDQQLDQQPDQ